MEHLQEFKEEIEIEEEESPQLHSGVFCDPSPQTRDVSTRGGVKVRQAWGAFSASLGSMRPLLAKLDNLLLDPPERCTSKKVKDGMHLLKKYVKEICSCLETLSELEDPPPTTKCWMNEARDLSYRMEDYIDNLIFTKPTDRSVVSDDIKTTKSPCKWFSRVKAPKGHEQIVAMVSEFKKCARKVIQRRKVYVLSDSKIRSTLTHRVVSVSHILPMPYEETVVIVIDGRMSEFINSLANDGDEQLKVVSILGSSSLGKTTLARVLYDRIGKQYHCRAFIRLSRKPDMKRIFQDMLSQLLRQDPPEYRNEVDLIDNIKTYLQNKRYLIVIDDLWTTSMWDIINHALPKGSHGSRIITTTQIEDIALTCSHYQPEHVFKMKPLDYHHSRKLFFNRLFGSESDCPEELKEVSNKIVEICDGLPLATISMASLLASQPVMSVDLFTYIHKSLGSCFLENPASGRTRQALNLSFNNLPHYLKTCLMYLIMYPEGYTFFKDNLVKQWVAEGFIGTIEGHDIKKVAEIYLGQLIARRFIQPICVNYNNEVVSFEVHDAVYDLIAHKSAEENFIVAIDYSRRKNAALYQKARRLSLRHGGVQYGKIPSNINKLQVRSLVLFGLLECMCCIGEFKLLRVLNLQLSGPRHGNQDPAIDLTGLSELVHLRYLKIVCDVYIKLPNHLRGLQCLETLDVMGTEKGTHIPWDIIYLPHLLHLSLPVDTNLLHRSVSLEGIGKLNHLQDLYISTQPSPDHLERSMEALGSLIGGHGNLKTIVVAHGSSIRHGSASKATIYWNNVAPPPHLKRFECSWRNGIIFHRIPRWMEQLGNLSILKIAVGELMLYDIGILRGLPALTCLSLYGEKAPYNKIHFDKAGFSVLKYFKWRFTRGIAWLKFGAEAMPNLLKLKLVFNTSGIIRIEHMPSLREISVKFGGAAAGREHRLVTNHESNPRINEQPVDYSSNGDKSRKQKQQPCVIVEEEHDEYNKKLKSPADQRNSVSTKESSSQTNVPEVRVEERSHPGEAPVFNLKSSSWTEYDLSQAVVTMSLHDFTVADLKLATSNFNDEKLSYSSGHAKIYEGSINDNLGLCDFLPQKFVVVHLAQCNHGEDNEWLAGPVYLETKQHPHLVKLLGFCKEYPHRFLVYEYMPEGTLKIQIENGLLASIPWITRLKIAVGAAKGLAFLREVGTPMISRDFDASNILLDLDYTAKLWRFGLAKENPLYTTAESEVYNLGVVLLQLLTGRKQGSGENDLVTWASPFLFHEGLLDLLMDPRLEGQYSWSVAFCAVTTASRCLQSVPQKRPSMRDVVQALEPLLSVAMNDGPEPKETHLPTNSRWAGQRRNQRRSSRR